MLPTNTAIALLIMMVCHIILINSFEHPSKEEEEEVKLVSVVFRHGDRTPDTIYPKILYDNSIYTDGIGELIDQGKRRVSQLGEKLRERYNKFLGPIYHPGDVYTRSTDFTRTKMTLQFVLESLYPNNNLPIPITFEPRKKDKLLLRMYYCKLFTDIYENLKTEKLIQADLKGFDQIENEMSKKTGWSMNDVYDLYIFYCNLVCLKYMNKTLPTWTNEKLNVLENSTFTLHNLMNYNNKLKKLNGGALLKKVTKDMQSVAYGSKKKTKIFLYSGHDLNVYAMLAALNVVKPHLPEFTSAVIIELYTIEEAYYVRVLHYLGIPSEMKTVDIPNCASPCALEAFYNSIEDVIPSNEEFNC